MKLIIFADGNEQIGGGHISRCLTIAREAERKGIPAAFLFSDADSEALYQSFGGTAPCLILGQDSRHPAGAKELFPVPEEMVKKALAADLFKPEEQLCFLVDSYAAPLSLMEGLTRYGLAAYFDDLHGERPKAVLRIDYDEDLRLVPVREGFSERPVKIRESAKRLLFASGAGDFMGIGEALAENFREQGLFRRGIELHLLRGPLFTMRDAGCPEGVYVHPPQGDMPEFLSGFDLILTAAGNMLYEAAAMGLPAISYSFSDNQISGAKAMERAGVRYFGDYREQTPEAFAGGILEQALKLAEDQGERERISALERRVIDGKGAERIVGFLNEQRI